MAALPSKRCHRNGQLINYAPLLKHHIHQIARVLHVSQNLSVKFVKDLNFCLR